MERDGRFFVSDPQEPEVEPYIPVPVSQHKHYRTGQISSDSLSTVHDIVINAAEEYYPLSTPVPLSVSSRQHPQLPSNSSYAQPYTHAYLQDQLPPDHPLSQYSDDLAAVTDGSARLRPSLHELQLLQDHANASFASPSIDKVQTQTVTPSASLPYAADLREIQRRSKVREGYVSKIQSTVDKLPPKLKAKVSDDDVKKLASWMLNSTTISLLTRLRKQQTQTEQTWLEEREALVEKHAQDREELLKVRTTAASDEIAAFDDRCATQILEKDKYILRACDQLVLDMQHELSRADMPLMRVTTDLSNIAIQMKILAAVVKILGIPA